LPGIRHAPRGSRTPVRNTHGMDAAAIAERVIEKQQSFLKTLEGRSIRP
jgi:hypothetical protein